MKNKLLFSYKYYTLHFILLLISSIKIRTIRRWKLYRISGNPVYLQKRSLLVTMCKLVYQIQLHLIIRDRSIMYTIKYNLFNRYQPVKERCQKISLVKYRIYFIDKSKYFINIAPLLLHIDTQSLVVPSFARITVPARWSYK